MEILPPKEKTAEEFMAEEQKIIAQQVADVATQDVMQQLSKMDNPKKAGWLSHLKERAAARVEKMKADWIRRSQDWEVLGYVSDALTGKPVLTKDKTGIQVKRYIGWDRRQGRYTGAKLRQIRREQTLQAVAGKTHYNDRTPINQAQLVDLWKGA